MLTLNGKLYAIGKDWSWFIQQWKFTIELLEAGANGPELPSRVYHMELQ